MPGSYTQFNNVPQYQQFSDAAKGQHSSHELRFAPKKGDELSVFAKPGDKDRLIGTTRSSERKAAVEKLKKALVAEGHEKTEVEKVFKQHGVTSKITVGQFKAIDLALNGDSASTNEAKRSGGEKEKAQSLQGPDIFGEPNENVPTGLEGKAEVVSSLNKAKAEVQGHLNIIGTDPRFHGAVASERPTTKEKVKDALTSPTTYLGPIPYVGTAIGLVQSVKEGVDGNNDHKIGKTLSELATHHENPLLVDLANSLSKQGAKQRNEAIIGGMIGCVSAVVGEVIPGLGSVATKGATAVGSAIGGTVIDTVLGTAAETAVGEGLGKMTGKVEGKRSGKQGVTPGAEFETGIEKKPGFLQQQFDAIKTGGFERLPESATETLSDFTTAKALIKYLGMPDQREIIKEQVPDSDEQAALLEQEEARLALKRSLGSYNEQDFIQEQQATPEDRFEVKDLARRETKVKDGAKYQPLHNDEPERNFLKDLWIATGLLPEPSLSDKAKGQALGGYKKIV